MEATNLSKHMKAFIEDDISSRRYGLATKEHKNKLDALRSVLAEGAAQARNGEFVDDFSMDTLIKDLDAKS